MKIVNAAAVVAVASLLSGCGEAPAPFELKFAALSQGQAVGCTSQLTGFGPSGAHRIGINDLRFFVSNVEFKDAAGKSLDVTFDQNEMQYLSPEGFVSLVDLTGTSEGTCSPAEFAESEGTARTHLAITGQTTVSQVKTVSFDVGVPQAVMKKVIATTTTEAAPSPLGELYWSWNSGYRHFVFNFTVADGAGQSGGGFMHIGSRSCGPTGEKALSDRDSCDFVNTPKVQLDGFDLKTDTVGIDLDQALTDVDFKSPIYDANFMVIGEGVGVECHSSPMQPDCGPIFSHFGVNMTDGKATASSDVAFRRQ